MPSRALPLVTSSALSPAHPGLGAQIVGRRATHDTIGWLVCFFSLTALLLQGWSATLSQQWVTTVLVLLLLAPWGLIVVRQPAVALRAVLLNWGILLLPLLAVSSTLWSNYPSASLKGGTEYLVTTILGVWFGYCIKPRQLMSALLSALVILSILSVFFGTGAYSSFTGGYTFVGIFGSKNNFAVSMAFLLLTAVTVAFDRDQPRTFRLMGLLGAILAIPLLYYARSVGALVVCTITLMGSWLLRIIIKIPPKPRAALLALLSLLVTLLIVLATLDLNFADLLGSVGKDVTLSGRTLLWDEAFSSIAENPLGGTGYDGFWQVGNWGAEELWYYSHIPEKYGYHFHNTYLQVSVDLGLAGLAVFVGMLLIIIGRTVAILLARPLSSGQLFAITVFMFLLLRTPLEVDLFFQFQIASILLCVIWIYLRPQAKLAAE